MLTLYQLEWCPSCHTIRQVLTELGLTYTAVNVPFKAEQRAQVMALSGQGNVPVLQDGDRVLSDATAIVEHLRSVYASPPDAAAQAEKGSWRIVRQLSVSPQAACVNVKRLLEDKGFSIVSETRGPEISQRLAKEYVVLGVVLDEAAVHAVESDVRAPGAVLLPVAIAPTSSGGSVVAAADPVGQVWLFADAPLRKSQAVVKRRLLEIFAAL